MRVYFGDGNGAVSQHFLDVSNVYIRLQKACCEGVAEHMGRDVQIYGCHVRVPIYHSAHRLIRHRFSPLVYEKIAAGLSVRAEAFVVFH